MNDTVTRLMGLAGEWADAHASMKHSVHYASQSITNALLEREKVAHQALQDELTRLFTPLSDEQIRASTPYGMRHMTDGVIRELARAVEKAHGIGGETK